MEGKRHHLKRLPGGLAQVLGTSHREGQRTGRRLLGVDAYGTIWNLVILSQSRLHIYVIIFDEEIKYAFSSRLK